VGDDVREFAGEAQIDALVAVRTNGLDDHESDVVRPRGSAADQEAGGLENAATGDLGNLPGVATLVQAKDDFEMVVAQAFVEAAGPEIVGQAAVDVPGTAADLRTAAPWDTADSSSTSGRSTAADNSLGRTSAAGRRRRQGTQKDLAADTRSLQKK